MWFRSRLKIGDPGRTLVDGAGRVLGMTGRLYDQKPSRLRVLLRRLCPTTLVFWYQLLDADVLSV